MSIQIENLDKVNKILKDSLKDYEAVMVLSEDTIDVVSEEINSLHPTTPKSISEFYIYVGCVAVINDIEILNPVQMKNSLGFAELTTLLETLFIESGNENLVPTIESSSSVFNTIYSKTDLASFGSSWERHIIDDVKSISKMIDKDEQPDELTPYKNLKKYFSDMGEDAKFKYDAEIENVLGFLSDSYESTYQLIKPKGIILPSPDDQNPLSMITCRGTDGKVDVMEGTSNLFRNISKNLNNLFNISDDLDVNITDDTFSIKAILESESRVFFVRPHLKLLFGRNLFSSLGENGNFNRPMGARKYPTWSSAEDEVRKFVEKAFQNLIIYHFRNKAKSWYDIDVENNSMEDACTSMNNIKEVMMLEDQILKDFKKLSSSIITTYFISEFGGTKESPSKISIRGTFYENDITSEQLFTAITQDSGKRITEEEKVDFTPKKVIQPVPLNNLVVYQYDHTFNNASANAVPLFAAKALEYINQNIQYIRSKNPNADVNGVSWENLLVGMTKDGFIEQGQDKMQLIRNIVHWLSAGSRAGKGVASYNLIIPQVLEDRLFFYGDRKPDTVIVLAQQAGLNPDGTPRMAYVNGGQFNAISAENEKFINWQEKLIAKNKPKWLDIKDRSTLDDLIYLRQAMIVFSVIDMLTMKGIPTVNTELGFESDFIKGISAVFDEYTNFQKSFLERLDPFTTQDSLLKGVLNEDIFHLIEDPESDSYKSVEKKGLLKYVTTSNSWKMNMMNTLIDANSYLSSLKNAGIQTISQFIDILVIGQGFRGENTKNIYDLPKGKNTGEYIKGGVLPGLNTNTLDPMTTLLKIIPNHDYILGTPPDSENGQIYDLIDANGKNYDTYGQYLNRNYRGFCYINRNDIDNNPRAGFVFKPFLLLNEGSEPQELKEMAKKGRIDKSKMQEAITKYQNKSGGYLSYLANEVDNIKGTSWLEVRKELKDTLGLDNKGESLAGVIPYSEKIGFNPDKYNKTVIFMNEVVKRLGYEGSYHEFVCDLRPEWSIGIPDLRIGVFEGIEAFKQRDSIRGIRAYAKSPVYDESKGHLDLDLLGLNVNSDEDYDDLDNLNDFPEDNIEGYMGDLGTFDDEETTTEYPEDNTEENVSSIDDFVPNVGGLFSHVEGFKPSDIVDENSNSAEDDLVEEVASKNTFTTIPNTDSEELVIDNSELELEKNKDFEEEERKKKEEIEKERKRQESEMSSEQREYYYMGVKDAMSGQLAFETMNKLKLDSLGMTLSYELGYKMGFKQSPKKLRIEHLCTANFPESIETARVLGIDNIKAEESILKGIDNLDIRTVEKSKLRNPRDVFKDPIMRHVSANSLNKIENEYGKTLKHNTMSSYGLTDSYVVGGTVGTISNLDTAITIPFEPKINSDTGKYDPDITLTDYIQRVTEEIINKVGSYGQFNSITVTNNGQMIVNDMLRMSFAVPQQEYDKFPWGIKKIVDNQEWAKLFSWRELRNMPYLSTLTIDSINFAMSFLRPFLSKQNVTIDQSLLLKEFGQLYGVVLEGEALTRNEIKPDNYWKGFKVNSKAKGSEIKVYTANKFEHLKSSMRDKYSNEKSLRKEMKQHRKDKYNSDYEEYVQSADTRSERIRRKREVQYQMSSDGIKSAFREKNFRKLVSEAGYGLRVIPGILLAKRKTRR